LAELTKEQNKHFCQLGEKLAAIQTADAAVAPELNAVNSTKKEIESIQVGIQSLEYQGTDDSKNAFSKMIWLIILFVIVLIVIIAAIVIAFGPKKQGPLSLDEIRNPGQNKEISSPEDALKEVTGLFKKQLNKGENKAVTVSDKDTLAAALPTGSWKPEKTSYHKAKLGELEYSILDTTYAGPDGQSINVQVTDSADVSSLLSGIQMILLTNLSHEDENGYEKISEYDNMKVIEKYSKNPPFASFGFIVKDRYIVNIKCDHENGIGILKQFIAGFDFSKLP
jgi:hypothetical protein